MIKYYQIEANYHVAIITMKYTDIHAFLVIYFLVLLIWDMVGAIYLNLSGIHALRAIQVLCGQILALSRSPLFVIKSDH